MEIWKKKFVKEEKNEGREHRTTEKQSKNRNIY